MFISGVGSDLYRDKEVGVVGLFKGEVTVGDIVVDGLLVVGVRLFLAGLPAFKVKAIAIF